jgi:hypothetical protein
VNKCIEPDNWDPLIKKSLEIKYKWIVKRLKVKYKWIAKRPRPRKQTG